MKVEIDQRPVTADRRSPFFALRLFPETNEEMASMEWGLCLGHKARIQPVINENYHYAIVIENDKD